VVQWKVSAWSSAAPSSIRRPRVADRQVEQPERHHPLTGQIDLAQRKGPSSSFTTWSMR
jgi:hypothetical protein